jgi:hypothetical protein
LLRRTTAVFILALVTALPLGVVGLTTGTATAGKTRTTTLISADFESSRSPRMSSDDSSIVDVGGTAGRVYRIRLQAGTIRGNPSGNHGVVAMVALPRQVNNACIRYRIRFGKGFDWSKGGKLPGLSGVAPGVSPTLPSGGGNPGDKGWSGRLMWGPRGVVESYMYYPTQPSYYGQGFTWKGRVSDGRWHVLRQCYVMNTVGKRNGVLRAWLDGTRVLNRTNHVYRRKNTVHISHLMWSIFRGGATMDWAGRWDSHIDFDQVRITTRG